MPRSPFALPSDVSSTLFEREYVMANGKEKRGAEFRSGRLAAECSLLQIGIAGEVGVADDRSPIWPERSVGSISHSDAFVWSIAGLTSDLDSLGVDTEPIAEATTVGHLKDEILLPGEEELLLEHGFDELTAFTLIFSAKESFYKCLYQLEPVFFGFHEVQVKSVDGETLVLELTDECPDELQRFDAIQIEYIVTNDNVFTACWMRSSE